MEDSIFKNDAKQVVDLLFNIKVFKDEITRDDMNDTENLIKFMLQHRFDSYIRAKELSDRLKKIQ